jgi:putative hydrolase of the HAD superfamily
MRQDDRLQAVTLDATGTLFHCPRLGEIYADVLGRHGVGVEASEAGRLVRLVWQELGCSAEPAHDRFGAHPEGERGFWRQMLDRVCEYLGAPASPFAAAELFHRFAQAEAWEVYPEVPAALHALAADGLRLAVVSNWDHRLPSLLGQMGLSGHFATIVYSAAVGVEKPHPGIFARALSVLGVAAPRALHVGDRRVEDAEGAEAVGMRGLLLSRQPGTRGDLTDLSVLPALARALW